MSTEAGDEAREFEGRDNKRESRRCTCGMGGGAGLPAGRPLCSKPWHLAPCPTSTRLVETEVNVSFEKCWAGAPPRLRRLIQQHSMVQKLGMMTAVNLDVWSRSSRCRVASEELTSDKDEKNNLAFTSRRGWRRAITSDNGDRCGGEWRRRDYRKHLRQGRK
jgi:hypothetical protein